MTSWIITVPQNIDMNEYMEEIRACEDRLVNMNYRLPYRPKAKKGDRCYFTYRGWVRGWMEIVDVVTTPGFICNTTGTQWPEGHYIQRSGPLHLVKPVAMPGFRGIRKYIPQENEEYPHNFVAQCLEIFNYKAKEMNSQEILKAFEKDKRRLKEQKQ
jgi:hypothetical protein